MSTSFYILKPTRNKINRNTTKYINLYKSSKQLTNTYLAVSSEYLSTNACSMVSQSTTY